MVLAALYAGMTTTILFPWNTTEKLPFRTAAV